MTKKDNEKDSDRPHYYSQFWLDIAAGRRTIGGPRSDEDEPLDDIPEPAPAPRRAAHNGQERSSAYDGLQQDDEDEAPILTVRGRAAAAPVAVHEEVVEPEPELEQEPEASDIAVEDIGDLDLHEAAVEDGDIPDMDLEEEPLQTEDEEEEFFDDEDEEEDEWSVGRGRKKAKPIRPTKPAPKQRPRREPRRGGY